MHRAPVPWALKGVRITDSKDSSLGFRSGVTGHKNKVTMHFVQAASHHWWEENQKVKLVWSLMNWTDPLLGILWPWNSCHRVALEVVRGEYLKASSKPNWASFLAWNAILFPMGLVGKRARIPTHFNMYYLDNGRLSYEFSKLWM